MSQREITKNNRAEESQEQRENRLAAKRKIAKENRAEDSQVQSENRLAAQREITKRSVSRNYKNNVKTGLRLKEIMQKKACRGITRATEDYRLAFRYSPVDDYSLRRCVQIGTMSKFVPIARP